MGMKIRPYAEIYTASDSDGWHEWDEIRYRCPKCNKIVREKEVGCADCEVFFDWSAKARIRVVKEIVWE